MKSKIMTCLLLLVLFAAKANAQDEIEFSPDCPGATTGVDIMPQWKIDWETGMSHEWNRRNGAHERTWTVNTSMFRMGLTDNTELRFQIDECFTHTPGDNYSGIANAAIGTKIRIFNGWKALPKVSFLGTFLLPGGESSHYLPPHLGIQTHLLFENSISDILTLGYDIGTEWSGDTTNPDVFFGLCVNLQATDRLAFFIESYNRYNAEKQDDWAAPGHSSHFNCMTELGASYMVTPRLQINMYGDFNFNEPTKYANLGVGMAWLLN